MYHDSSPLTTLVALFSQENFFACKRLCFFRDTLKSSESSTSMILEAIACSSNGSKRASSLPITSGTLVVFDPIVAAPHCIASSAGKPKPS